LITALSRRVQFRTAGATLLACATAAAGHLAPLLSAHHATNTGRIEGQVRLVMPQLQAMPSGVYPSRRVSRPAPKGAEIANVVVSLKNVPRQGDLPLTPATITQKDEAFVPHVVAITRGSTVSFPNADPFFHNVFSLSRGASFDLGRYPRGATRSHRFTAPGLVKVFCHIHSHMTASIIVFDHPYFRIPAADGSFALDDVPAGAHEVAAWHERIGESVTAIRVEAGRTTRVEFTLPVEHQ
jgi:plastocyanin